MTRNDNRTFNLWPILLVIALLIFSFFVWEAFNYAVNNVVCAKIGHDITCKLADPLNPN